MVGRTVSHYQVIERLGAGGMGEIYLAEDTQLTRRVAIKVLSAAHAGDAERRRRFLQEARAASALNHPNIITIYDIVFEGDTEYMVMEYVTGKTLADLIPRTGLPVFDVLDYAVQMTNALGAAHAAGIVHRDLKPGNVMITQTGWVKILDFGLAKRSPFASPAEGSTDATATVGSSPLTVEGSIIGTVSYMSPEQAESKPVDARSDIFSFGVVLYEMVTGRQAFKGNSILSTLTSILRDDAPSISEITTGVPPGLEQVVRRCLAKDPAARWQSMQEIRMALAELRRGGEAIVPVAAAPAPTAKRRLSIGALLAGVGVVLATGVLGWWGLTHRGAAPAVSSVATPANAAPSGPEPSAVAPGKTKVEEPPTPAATSKPKSEAPAARVLAVPDGLPLSVRLAEDIPSDAQSGMQLHFTVVRAVRIGDDTVVAANAKAAGEVVDGVKKKFIKNTKVTFRLKEVEAVDGASLAIRVMPKADGKDSALSVSAAKMAKHPKEVAAPAGTEYTAYSSGVQSVKLGK